ncbi:hypothetical protein G8A07_15530 [Roseateles sp. DAIF2]|uniref:hypothetical protein n=1 Tax=Roseateles sp. DAIF2 TaxID=2714952 RepID=UPI0018A2D5B1|nr:hypothetical protein [Roseateles sp. DAIF2]QPF74186.1 hypothetical protein G8A07_15530 [Roseateles sp. DAIF2]
MATVNLLFDRGPLAGPPFNLLFGDDGEIVIYEAALAGALPGPTLLARAVPAHDSALAAALPAPSFSAQLVPAHDTRLDGRLPAPVFAGEVAVLTNVVYEAALAGALPGPTFSGAAVPAYRAALDSTLPGPSFAAIGRYDINVNRPTVGQTAQPWQTARRGVAGVTQPSAAALGARAGAASTWTAARRVQAGVQTLSRGDMAKVRADARAQHQAGRPLRAQALDRFAELQRFREQVAAEFLTALQRRASATSDHQDRYRDRRPSLVSAFGQAQRLHQALRASHQSGRPSIQAHRAGYQTAMRPPAGYGYRPPIPPRPDPCYTPSTRLVFADRSGGPHLVFICDKHDIRPDPVIVPIREVYMVTNNVSLTRLVDGAPVPVLSASLSLEADSWTWGFSASLPGQVLSLVEPQSSGPVELLANINGTVFHVVVEQIARERAFGQSNVRVSGRGRNAVLDAPYAPVQTFTNPGQRTSQQLMDDVLTLNGVSLGWQIDWGLEAWPVPAGVFSHQGSYITALVAIAKAGGGYLQPHAEAKRFAVRPRYPVAPWDWGSVTPDFVLPSDVVTRESMTWREKPAYNRVFVTSGHGQGVTGQVTRAGSAGTVLAPMVVDQLITTGAAARQRGLAVLADTGRQVDVALRMPVLPETGVIRPGAFVQYRDGPAVRMGLVRSVGIAAGFPDVWQTLGVETHA